MSSTSILAFSAFNRRLILALVVFHLTWACAVIGFWAFGGLVSGFRPVLSVLFALLQLYFAAQLILPVLLLQPEKRSRGFYLFWGVLLASLVWMSNLYVPPVAWQPLLAAFQSSLLLFVATIIGAALARYIKRLWEIIPVCIVMTLADFASWLSGPTAGFVDELERYYTTFEGPPPLVDMILVKLAMPGNVILTPVFGFSDWIMVVFFAVVAGHFGVNDNLLGPSGEALARQGVFWRYLPVPAVALLLALALSQITGMFVPALPLIALTMLGWYGVRHLRNRKEGCKAVGL